MAPIGWLRLCEICANMPQKEKPCQNLWLHMWMSQKAFVYLNFSSSNFHLTCLKQHFCIYGIVLTKSEVLNFVKVEKI